MKLFGWEVSFKRHAKALQGIDESRGGWRRILESFPGAWQQDVVVDRDTVLAYSAVFACATLIAQDIGKLRPKLVQQQKNGIWKETTSPSFSPVLRKPNATQNRINFYEHWVISKLVHGNAYALKRRDNRGIVVALHLLDPCRVKPLVADDGSVFYELQTDNLANLGEVVTVPAREIIHDLMVPLFHPLIGVSPIYACGLAATQGIKIQRNSARFFENMSRPSGVLSAPGHIGDDTATRLKEKWEENFGGDKIGRVAVLGDGLAYQPMAVNPVDAQLIEQLKWSAETVCSCFHVPPYMIGVGVMPSYNNIEALNQQYYNQALQEIIEKLELSLDEGLDLVTPTESLGVEFDLCGLLRMDTAARYKSHTDGISGGWLKPNEARYEEDMEPVAGGDTPYMQQQNYSLAALAERDADKPFSKPTTAPVAAPAANDGTTDDEEPPEETDAKVLAFDALFRKEAMRS